MSHFDPSRLEKVRRVLKEERLDAWIMSITDPYLSEYVAPHWQSVHWLTGFSGSAAVVCITPTEAALFTDSRYWSRIKLKRNFKVRPSRLFVAVPHKPRHLWSG